MSEHLPRQEKLEQLRTPETHEHEKKHHEQFETRNHQKAEADTTNVEAMRHKIEKTAKNAKETRVDSTNEHQSAEHYLVTKGLKQEAFRRSLQRARKHMSTTSRGFSKVIHQPVVDTISRVGEKTVARPTGILTGALIALIGSSYLLYTAKHNGFQYNYSVIIILLGGGYILGLVIELVIYGLRRIRPH